MKKTLKAILWGLGGVLALIAVYWSAEVLFRLLVYWCGPEFFVGAANGRHLDDGTVIYTNPLAMLFWVNVLAVAEFVLIIGILRGIKAWRSAARRGV